MRIGELAKQTGTESVTIRFYESKGLMPAPQRSEGNYRCYAPQDVERLLFIRHCRAMHMNLEEIAVLLRCRDQPAASCEVVNRMIDTHITAVRKQIDELQALESQLKRLRMQCDASRNPAGVAATCGILHSLDHCAGGLSCQAHRAGCEEGEEGEAGDA